MESQTVTTKLVYNYHELGSDPLEQIKITLSKPVETYSASILLSAHFKGLAWFMYHWRWTTGSLFVLNIMLIEVLLASYIWDVIKSCYVEEKPENSESANDEVTITERIDESGFDSKRALSSSGSEESFTPDASDGNMFPNVDVLDNFSNESNVEDDEELNNGDDDVTNSTNETHISEQKSASQNYTSNRNQSQNYSSMHNQTISGASVIPESQDSLSSACFHVPSSDFGGSLAAPSSRNYPKLNMESMTIAPEAPSLKVVRTQSSAGSSVVDEIDLSGLLNQDDEILLE